MKNGIAAVLVVGALLSTSGSTLAVGKLGGASGGLEIAGGSGPLFVGKMGGVSGADEFLLPPSLFVGKLGGVGGADEFLLPPTLFAGKMGGASGADEFLLPPSLFAGKLGGVTGEEIGALITGPEDVADKGLALSTNQVEPGGNE